MPGLVGIINRKNLEQNDQQVTNMLASMQYDDTYKSGVYCNQKMSVTVGWTIPENSICESLPVTNQAEDIILFFAGEIFGGLNKNFGDSKDSILNAKHCIRMYEEYDEKFVEQLNGWFCGLLLDTRRGIILLFNDRYGMHRVFVHESIEGLYFASEAKALLAVLPETREFDPKGLAEFLTCGCTLGSHSLYKGISIMPAGALWESEQGEVRKKKSYFDLEEWISQEHLDEKYFSHLLVDSFNSLIKRYSGGSLPVGVSLTGGLDSRMVMACLEGEPGKYPCYTFGSIYRDTLDVKTAREVATMRNQPYHVLVLGEEFIRNFQEYLQKAVYISDGYLGMSGAAELYLNSLARKISPVRLTGNYGGELLRGHHAFKCKIPQGGFIGSNLDPYISEAQQTFKQLEKLDSVTFALFNQAPSQSYGRLAIERSQVSLRTPFMDNDLVKLIYQAPPHLLKDEKLSLAIISKYGPTLMRIPTDTGMLCSGSLLKRMSLKLQRKLLIKAEYLSSHGMPNWLATISHFGLGRILENNFFGRNKFQHFRTWIQRELASSIVEIFRREYHTNLDEYIDFSVVNKMLDEHISGKKNYTEEIDSVVTLVLAEKLFLKHDKNNK